MLEPYKLPKHQQTKGFLSHQIQSVAIPSGAIRHHTSTCNTIQSLYYGTGAASDVNEANASNPHILHI